MDIHSYYLVPWLIQSGFFKNAHPRISHKPCAGSKFWGHVVFFNFWFWLLGHLFSPQFQCICPGEFFSLFKKVVFGGRFLNYEVVSITNSEAFALMKKAKTTCHSIVDNQSIFPVLIFQNYKFSKFWKILALNRKKINFGILKNKVD